MRRWIYWVGFAVLLSASAIDIPLTRISQGPSNTCATGTFVIETPARYQGTPLDVRLTVTAHENDHGSNCVVVDNNLLELWIEDNSSADDDAWIELHLQLVERGTTNPVVVDRIFFSAFDLDANPGSTDSDDVYLYIPPGVGAAYLAPGTRVAYRRVALNAAGTPGLQYNAQLEGWNGGNCLDTAGNPDPTCRGGAIFQNTSEIHFRVQNDNAYGTSRGSRLFLISLQISDFAILIQDRDYGDAPASYGQAGLDRSVARSLGQGLLPDLENAYQASSGADADDAVSDTEPALVFDDEDGVRVEGSDLQGAVLELGQTYNLEVDTYTESGETGRLNVWIDLNQDGDFEDAGEHLVQNQEITASGQQTHTYSLTLPKVAFADATYVRVSYSESSCADATCSTGGSGEVEDYRVVLSGKTIEGRLLEDRNGDADLSDVQPLAGATVALFDGDGNFLATTTTDSDGRYRFTVAAGNTYHVAVLSKTLVPTSPLNPGHDPGETWVEQTWGAAGSWGGALCDLDADGSTPAVERASPGPCYGGRRGGVSDRSSSLDLDLAEHVAVVRVGSDDVSGVDFGFSFNVVTNTHDADEAPRTPRACQGCLRQFLLNANAIAGPNAMRFVPAVPPNATGGGGSWWSVDLADGWALPSITDGATVVDGTAYDYARPGDTRNANPGTAPLVCGQVGVDGVAMERIDLPELEVFDAHTVDAIFTVDTTGSGVAIRRLAVYGSGTPGRTDPAAAGYNPDPTGDVFVVQAGTGLVLEELLVGVRADASELPAASRTRGNGIHLYGQPGDGLGGAIAGGWRIDRNLVAYAGHQGIFVSGAEVAGGEVRQNTVRHSNWLGRWNADGISVEGGTGGHRILENCVVDNNGPGLDSWEGTGGNLWRNNTVRSNGHNPDANPYFDGTHNIERFGVRIMNSGNTFERNVVAENYGAGVVVTRNHDPDNDFFSQQNQISQNSFYGNGSVAIDLDQTHGDDWASNPRGDGVTPNDGLRSATEQNAGMDYPIITLAELRGSQLHLEGYVGRPGQYVAGRHRIEVYKADDDGNNNGEVVRGDGLNEPHGEGRWYLGSCETAADGSFACDLSVPSGVTLSAGDAITATATDADRNTSEFSANATVVLANRPPVATDDAFTTDEDTPLNVSAPGVLGNDSDPDGDSLTVTALTWDTNGDGIADTVTVGTATDVYDGSGTLAGQLTIHSDGGLDFTPASNYNGTVGGITYTVSDGNGGTATARVIINVTPVNDAPVANDDRGVGRIGAPVTLPITGNDTDTDGTIDPTTVDLDPASVPGGVGRDTDGDGDIDEVTVPGEGVWAVDESGNLTFTPEAGFTGDPTPIRYTVRDNDGLESNPATVTIDYPQADLKLNKTVSPAGANPGDTVTFTVTVTNDGPDTATGVEVTDRLPSGYTHVTSNASQGSYDPGTGRWSGLTLASGASATLTITATVQASGDHTNVAEVTASDAADPDSIPGDGAGDDYETATPVILGLVADLELKKEVVPEQASPGDRVSFVLTLVNRGPADATGIEVADPLPSGYAFESAEASQGHYNPVTGIWVVGSLPAGSTAELRLEVRVLEEGEYRNLAEVVASSREDPDSRPNNGREEEDDLGSATPEVGVPLLLEKRVEPREARVGDVVVYTVRVRNPSTVEAGFELVDRHDRRLIFLGMLEGPEPEREEGILAWRGLTLAPGGELKLRYRMRVGPGSGTHLDNVVQLRRGAGGFPAFEARALARLQVEDPLFARRPNLLLGRVYVDLNGNRRYDRGVDVPVPGARVLLSNGRQVRTDGEGRYAFRDLVAGVWQVALDPAGIPAGPARQAGGLGSREHRQRVWVQGPTVLDFPLVAPEGFVQALRSTEVRRGPVRVAKRLLPLGEGRYRVVLRIHAFMPVENVRVEDPLPGGGTRRFRYDRLSGEVVETYELEGEVWLTDPVIRWGFE